MKGFVSVAEAGEGRLSGVGSRALLGQGHLLLAGRLLDGVQFEEVLGSVLAFGRLLFLLHLRQLLHGNLHGGLLGKWLVLQRKQVDVLALV